MANNHLTALSPLDGRYHRHTAPLNAILSEFGLMKYRCLVELKWLKALAQCPEITELPAFSQETKNFLNEIFEEFSLDDAQAIKAIENTTNHDVKALEYFLKDKVRNDPALANAYEWIHFACTSEDINNLAYALIVKTARDKIILPMMQTIIQQLDTMVAEYADIAMLGRTHGQAATPTTLGKEIANITTRLENAYEQVKAVKIKGKINGSVGNFNAHIVAYPEVDWLKMTKEYVEELGLTWNAYTTQIEPHDHIAELSHAIMRFNTILIDLCRDVWGYISLHYFKQKLVAGEVGSSTMPHKVNPIDFENAEGNAGLSNAMLAHFAEKLPISRWQRDLSDSTVLRAMGSAFGHQLIALHAVTKGLDKLDVDEATLKADLDNHWEVLAEPLQTVMRRYGIESPYEKLKELTRGKKFSQKDYQAFVQKLELPKEVIERLSALSPYTYLGLASKLAQEKA